MAVDGSTGQAQGGRCAPADTYAVRGLVMGRPGRGLAQKGSEDGEGAEGWPPGPGEKRRAGPKAEDLRAAILDEEMAELRADELAAT